MFDKIVIEKKDRFSKEETLLFFEKFKKNDLNAKIFVFSGVSFIFFLCSLDIYPKEYLDAIMIFLIVFGFGFFMSSIPIFDAMQKNLIFLYDYISIDSMISVILSPNVSIKLKRDLIMNVNLEKIKYASRMELNKEADLLLLERLKKEK